MTKLFLLSQNPFHLPNLVSEKTSTLHQLLLFLTSIYASFDSNLQTEGKNILTLRRRHCMYNPEGKTVISIIVKF